MDFKSLIWKFLEILDNYAELLLQKKKRKLLKHQTKKKGSKQSSEDQSKQKNLRLPPMLKNDIHTAFISHECIIDLL